VDRFTQWFTYATVIFVVGVFLYIQVRTKSREREEMERWRKRRSRRPLDGTPPRPDRTCRE